MMFAFNDAEVLFHPLFLQSRMQKLRLLHGRDPIVTAVYGQYRGSVTGNQRNRGSVARDRA